MRRIFFDPCFAPDDFGELSANRARFGLVDQCASPFTYSTTKDMPFIHDALFGMNRRVNPTLLCRDERPAHDRAANRTPAAKPFVDLGGDASLLF